uniref:Uncharacterized protein n=1 Tax=Setaria viridis TaxID=4556 RepID=A0A4U6U2Q3_SETVI|nr:hypothetical protein SEVIR_7G334401v2 [Setaria viridis]
MGTRLGGAPCGCFGAFTRLPLPAAARLRLPPARAADTSASQPPPAARLRGVLLEQVDEASKQGERRGRALPRARLAGGGRRAPGLWRSEAVLGGLSISAALEISQLQILFLVLGLLSLWSVDFLSRYILVEG